MPHILVVDDDPHIRDVVCFALEKAGYVCSTASDGHQALSVFQAEGPDLVVLDIGLPEIDGLEVCRCIRKTDDTPILFLSARDDEIDRILGLEIGGDDYVTKPFSPREVVTRIGVILRRLRSGKTTDAPDILSRGALTLDCGHRSLKFSEQDVELTAIEFDLLRTFLGRPRQTFTRDQIMVAAYPPNIHVSDRTIDSHVRNIRSKLSAAGCATVIETVHGFGFRLGSCQISDDGQPSADEIGTIATVTDV